MDIAFGLGPRINAVSRIHGDASFCVELLTERYHNRAQQLVDLTELANTRRKAMQAQVLAQARAQLLQKDLSTSAAIVLVSDAWPPGVLGIVAGQLAREYNRPAFIFRIEARDIDPKIDLEDERSDRSPPQISEDKTQPPSVPTEAIATGSARSIAGIDLYDLLQTNEDLLSSFGGHPLAAGLRLPVANLPLLEQRLNQSLRRRFPAGLPRPVLEIDLDVTVAELGQSLFRQIAQLEPYGMGNPIPKLLVKQVHFEEARYRNRADAHGSKVRYPFTTLMLCDRTGRIPGIWWGHASYELPTGICDVVVELDYMSARRDRPHATFDYQVRLIDIHPVEAETIVGNQSIQPIDLRGQPTATIAAKLATLPNAIVLDVCPSSWSEIICHYQGDRPFVLAYKAPNRRSSRQAWETLVGWAKSLHRSGDLAQPSTWADALGLSEQVLSLGLRALKAVGFDIDYKPGSDTSEFSIPTMQIKLDRQATSAIETFQLAVSEADFLKHYFYQVSVEAIARVLSDRVESVTRIKTANVVTNITRVQR